MGWMDGLEAEKYDRTYSDWQLARRVAPYFLATFISSAARFG